MAGFGRFWSNRPMDTRGLIIEIAMISDQIV
jgi:hypothetical protein